MWGQRKNNKQRLILYTVRGAVLPMSIHTLAALLGLTLISAGMMSPYDSVHKNEAPSEETQRREHRTIFVLLAVMLLLRIAYVFHYHIDSDEPQHLHVVWGWTQGLLQYRDVFDNHTPLFHLLCAPLLAVLGERPEVLYVMRLAMIPLYGLALWSTYRIGRELFSQRVGLWAAVFTGLFPGFFFCALEFRTDDLWVALWLLALALLVQGRLTLRRSLLVGVILGAAVGVSLKTTLLLAPLGAAALAAVILTAKGRSQPSLHYLTLCATTALLGLSLVPLALVLFFMAKGAWAPFFYGTVQHNLLPELGRWKYPEQALLFPMILPLLWWSMRAIARHAPRAGNGARRGIIFLTAMGYISALFSFWPLLTREDYLPFYPLLILLLTPVILELPHRIARWKESRLPTHSLSAVWAPTLVAVLEIALLLGTGLLWRDNTREEITLLADVLRLTQPSDPIIDLKGETVFRPRSSYYVLEGITKARIKRGLIPDDIPERLIATRTCVAVADNDQFSPRTRTFLQENYVPVGQLRVAGRLLTAQAVEGATFTFDIQIPARYAIVAESGTAKGWLDGTPLDGARFLAPGRHEFHSSSGGGQLAVVWAQAVERGFSPFLPPGEAPTQITKDTRKLKERSFRPVSLQN